MSKERTLDRTLPFSKMPVSSCAHCKQHQQKIVSEALTLGGPGIELRAAPVSLPGASAH